jgi:hypothetical protein
MLKHHKLPLAFDAHRILNEIEQLPDDSWKEHFNKSFYTGSWSIIPLRAKGGEVERSFTNPALNEPFMNTVHLLSMPYTKSIMDSFKCDKTMVRFMKLDPESSILEHRDYNLSINDEDIRLHIPVQTHSAVGFWLDDEPIQLATGSCWYLNFNLKHRLYNPGPISRIHLVLDLKINNWVRSLVLGQNTHDE